MTEKSADEVAGNPGTSHNGCQFPAEASGAPGRTRPAASPQQAPATLRVYLCPRTPAGALEPRTGGIARGPTHPTSKMDLLFFTARARHFPPSLVILFSPSLQREPCPHQLPAAGGGGGGLHHQHPRPQLRAPLGRCGTRSTHALGFLSRKDPKP